jgi:predicted HAD superfamily phosphohydrolase
MFTRILTADERAAIKQFLAADGTKEHRVRNIAYRTKKHLPQIEADLALMKKLMKRYYRPQGK